MIPTNPKHVNLEKAHFNTPYTQTYTTLSNNIVRTSIITAIQNVVNSEFYLIKFSSIQKRYISSNIKFKNIIEDYLDSSFTVGDLLDSVAKNMETILPIPILNGKLLLTNYSIRDLPSKLMIVFVNMNTRFHSIISNNDNPITLEYVMNIINNQFGNPQDQLSTIFNTSNPVNITPYPLLNVPQVPPPPPPLLNIPHPPPTPPPITSIPYTTPPLLNPIMDIMSSFNILNVPGGNDNIGFLSANREKYCNELNTLKNMGFTDEAKMIEGLIVSDGDINSAINYYLQ